MAKKAKSQKTFREALKNYGKWREAGNMDRFVTLVFLTAKEKTTFCERVFGFPDVDYLDGAEVEELKITAAAQKELNEAEG